MAPLPLPKSGMRTTHRYKLNEHKDGWWTFMKQFVQMIKISKICTCTMNDVNLMLLSIKFNVKFDVWEEAMKSALSIYAARRWATSEWVAYLTVSFITSFVIQHTTNSGI